MISDIILGMSKWTYGRLVIDEPTMQYPQPDGSWGAERSPQDQSTRFRQLYRAVLVTRQGRQQLDPLTVDHNTGATMFDDPGVHFLDQVGEQGWEYLSQGPGFRGQLYGTFLLRLAMH